MVKKEERLLLMGVSSDSMFVLDYAKRLGGVYTVVTDYNSPEICAEKKLADEYWMIDLREMDQLEKKCREEQITAVYAGNNEFCLDQTQELCRRLGLPFYLTRDSWAYARDKIQMKSWTQKFGLPAARSYKMSWPPSKEQISQLHYPVVVKPTDACGCRGLSYCGNEAELLRGYENALNFSEKGEILVEDFIEGKEVQVYYFVVHGTPVYIGLLDMVSLMGDGMVQCVLGQDHEELERLYLSQADGKVREMLCSMGYLEGNVALQFIKKDGTFYFLELAPRLEGAPFWNIWKQRYGFSPLELMVDLALGREYSKQVENLMAIQKAPRKKAGMYMMLWIREGTVERITGVDQVKRIPGVSLMDLGFCLGDHVKLTMDISRMVFYISIVVDCDQEMEQVIQEINGALHIYNEKGEEMLGRCRDPRRAVVESRSADKKFFIA